jgi:hypothetical protein
MKLEDGTGKGFSQRVDGNFRAHTDAITRSDFEEAVRIGDGYNFNTGAVSITVATEAGLMYLKNNESVNLHIEACVIGLGPSTGGVDPAQIRLIRNPSAGTLISTATDVDIKTNRNFGSSNTFTGDVYKSTGALTITDGTDHILSYMNASSRLFLNIYEVLPPGSSIGVTMTLPSNTAVSTYCALICHLEDPLSN